MAHRKHYDDDPDNDEMSVRRTLAGPSADMNVTPLIDVLLVLLIIFMAALPLTQRGQDINLPLEVNAASKPQDNTQVLIEYSAERVLTVNRTPVTLENLGEYLRGIFENRKDKTAFVHGDARLRYQEVMAVIDAASGAGLRVGIVTDGMRSEGQRMRGGR